MKFPPLLRERSKVRIVAPSGRLPSSKSLHDAVQTLKEWDLNVEFAQHVWENHNVFSASDANRLKDFQEALDDATVELIVCARGGYGLTRILDELELENFNEHPKWLIGYSDITAFLQKAVKMDIATIHGPMGTSFSRKGAEGSINALKNLLFNGISSIETKSKQSSTGKASGQLVGGNLAMVCDSIGTSSELKTENRILILEDVGEHYYRVDRMFTQLKRAGKLSNLAGLAIGNFSSMVEGEMPFSETVEQMVQRLTNEFDYPIAVDMPVGHEPANFPFVYGADYSLEVSNLGAKLEILAKL